MIDLSALLPSGITLADPNQREVTVILTVEELDERMYTVDVVDSCYQGEKDMYNYSPIPETVSVRVRALSEELDSFTFTSSDMTIDVSELEPGFNQVTIDIELDPVYEVVYVSSCVINVTEKSIETEDGPGSTGDHNSADTAESGE